MLTNALTRVVTRRRPASGAVAHPGSGRAGTSPAGSHDLPTVVRPMSERDLPQVAQMHEQALHHGFFVGLGARFLTAYHRSFLASPLAVALVAVIGDGDEVVGFVVGPLRSDAHYRWVVRHHGPRLALGALLGVLARPRLWGTFVRTRLPRYARGVWEMLVRGSRRRPGEAPPSVDRRRRPSPAVLTHVAIHEQARGRGIGGLLVSTFEEACRDSGATEIRLVTEAEGGAADFYREQGWWQADERTDRDGEGLLEFRRDLTAGP